MSTFTAFKQKSFASPFSTSTRATTSSSFTASAMDAPFRPLFSLLFISLLALHISVEVSGTTMTMYNKCSHPVWPGIQPGSGKPVLAKGGFKLLPHNSYTLQLPAGWSGRVWGRHGCSFDAAGRGRCATGDCGGNLFCNGLGGTPPATLAEITLGNDQDFYDVSLVDGYNLAISITPFRGKEIAPPINTCSPRRHRILNRAHRHLGSPPKRAAQSDSPHSRTRRQIAPPSRTRLTVALGAAQSHSPPNCATTRYHVKRDF